MQSADLIVKDVLKAYKLYKGDCIAVSFDLQIEAEVLGCELHWVDDCPPSVVTHPLEDYENACKLDALECYDKCVGKWFVMSPGCDLPYDTKIENLQAAASIVLDEYSREAALSITAAEGDSFDDIIIPDYAGS